jgi:hypothetical protein
LGLICLIAVAGYLYQIYLNQIKEFFIILILNNTHRMKKTYDCIKCKKQQKIVWGEILCTFWPNDNKVALTVVCRKKLWKARLTIMRILLFFDNTTRVKAIYGMSKRR